MTAVTTSRFMEEFLNLCFTFVRFWFYFEGKQLIWICVYADNSSFVTGGTGRQAGKTFLISFYIHGCFRVSAANRCLWSSSGTRGSQSGTFPAVI